MQRFLDGEAAHLDVLGPMRSEILLSGQGEMIVPGEGPVPGAAVGAYPMHAQAMASVHTALRPAIRSFGY